MRRFYIYVSKGRGARGKGQGIWSRDLAVPGERLPEWMIELADQVKMIEAELLTAGPLLPTGVIVGSAVIANVEKVAGCELLVARGESQLTANNQQPATLYRG